MGGVQFLFFGISLLVLAKFHFGGRNECQAIILSSFETFMIFPNFLRLMCGTLWVN